MLRQVNRLVGKTVKASSSASRARRHNGNRLWQRFSVRDRQVSTANTMTHQITNHHARRGPRAASGRWIFFVPAGRLLDRDEMADRQRYHPGNRPNAHRPGRCPPTATHPLHATKTHRPAPSVKEVYPRQASTSTSILYTAMIQRNRK